MQKIHYDVLMTKVKNKHARVAVVGLGYVGLPLAVEFAKAGFDTIGIDLDASKCASIENGVSYIHDVPDEDITTAKGNGNFRAFTDYKHIEGRDVIIICVPTPLRKTKDPDLSFIVSAVEGIKPYVNAGSMVILESTTYPGTTNDMFLPLAEGKGLCVGEDCFFAFSPERVDPGNKRYKTKDIPKVVGGITERCRELAVALYQSVVPSVWLVSSATAAEMVKLLENTFRSVNIGLVNEMAMMCRRMGVDIWEVIDAAATKPFGYMPFYPGPGIGGHCIPCDPGYLLWKAKMNDIEMDLVEVAMHVNYNMPRYIISCLADMLNDKGLPFKGAKILIVGVAYKRDVSDVRESPAIEVIKLLMEKHARVDYFDPYVNRLALGGVQMDSLKDLYGECGSYDCVVVITDHTNIDYEGLARNARLIFDTRNVYKKNRDNVVRL